MLKAHIRAPFHAPQRRAPLTHMLPWSASRSHCGAVLARRKAPPSSDAVQYRWPSSVKNSSVNSEHTARYTERNHSRESSLRIPPERTRAGRSRTNIRLMRRGEASLAGSPGARGRRTTGAH